MANLKEFSYRIASHVWRLPGREIRQLELDEIMVIWGLTQDQRQLYRSYLVDITLPITLPDQFTWWAHKDIDAVIILIDNKTQGMTGECDG